MVVLILLKGSGLDVILTSCIFKSLLLAYGLYLSSSLSAISSLQPACNIFKSIIHPVVVQSYIQHYL